MLLTQLDMLSLDMFASQTRDLYHIETAGYIEFAVRQIYRAEQREAYRQKDGAMPRLF